ncbi:MAG: hypothetical protein ACR2FG_10775 [Marmoricola sp.]
MTDPGNAWPPPGLAPHLSEFASWAAWWAGDTYALGQNSNPTSVTTTEQSRRRTGMWSRRRNAPNTAPARNPLHVPAAADVAQTSADLLFGEPPAFQFDDDAPQADELMTRLDDLMEDAGMANDLHHGAELCAAVGGIYLRPMWDVSLADRPLLTVIDQARAIPTVRAGVLETVTFFEEAEEVAAGSGTGVVWRHLERHERGRIVHELHKGSTFELGPARPFEDHPLTAWLAQVKGLTPDGSILTGNIDKGLLVSFVGNAPSRKHRTKAVGRADIAGSEQFLDALDEVWTSWMRDIRLGQARLLVPDSYLDVRPGIAGGRARTFDTDQEVFSPMAGMDESSQSVPQITPVQFAIRVAEHEQTAMALFERIITASGYAPQTFGIHTEGAISGTAHQLRELRSHRTTGRKQRAFRPAVEHTAHMLLRIGETVFGWTAAVRPHLIWPENDVEEPKARAETINMLGAAKAASMRTRVAMAQPQLDDPAIDEEVARIVADERATLNLTVDALAPGTEPDLGPAV